MDLDGITAEITALVEASYKRGFEQGRAAARDAIFKAVEAFGTPAAAVHGVGEEEAVASDEDGAVRKSRAPRGLTNHVVHHVLRESHGWLRMSEIQDRAIAADDRLSSKTVYNELYRGEGSSYRRNEAGNWSLLNSEAVQATALEQQF